MIKGNGTSTGQTIQARRAPDVKEIHVIWMRAKLQLSRSFDRCRKTGLGTSLALPDPIGQYEATDLDRMHSTD